jgi:hypothetical protein
MADRRDIEWGSRGARRRVGACASASSRARGSRVRCAVVPFSPWTCATCGSREDLVVAGSIAFCETCLESSVREDENDLYRDTGGGD